MLREKDTFISHSKEIARRYFLGEKKFKELCIIADTSSIPETFWVAAPALYRKMVQTVTLDSVSEGQRTIAFRLFNHSFPSEHFAYCAITYGQALAGIKRYLKNPEEHQSYEEALRLCESLACIEEHINETDLNHSAFSRIHTALKGMTGILPSKNDYRRVENWVESHFKLQENVDRVNRIAVLSQIQNNK